MAKKEKSGKAHYVDNKKFFAAMVEYKKEVDEADKQGKPRPQIPNYIGECFMQIAQHLSWKPNFIRYTYRDDMVSDGIENCIKYIDNFDPEKTNNPFAYFTQIIFYAFLRRIQREKTQLYVKYKSMEMHDITEALKSEGKSAAKTDILREDAARSDFITKYEAAMEEKKRKAKISNQAKKEREKREKLDDE